jgi:hypothetical protein
MELESAKVVGYGPFAKCKVHLYVTPIARDKVEVRLGPMTIHITLTELNQTYKEACAIAMKTF